MRASQIGLGVLVAGVLVLGCSLFVWANPENAWKESQQDATYVGAEECAACHEDVVKRQKLSTHYGTINATGKGVEGQESCESCHGPGGLHMENAGDTKFITRYSTEACFSCHADKRAQFDLQFHHPVVEGRMSCADCHELHAMNATHSATALERPNEKCFKCHKEFKGPYVFEHDPMREGCQVCHEPHGGVYDKLLVADQDALCLRCHWEQASNTISGKIGGVTHGLKPAGSGGDYEIGEGQECVDHHRAVHGSNMWSTFNR